MNVADLMHRLSKLPPHYKVFFADPGGRSAPHQVAPVHGLRQGHYLNYDGHHVLPAAAAGDPEDEVDAVVFLRVAPEEKGAES